MFYFQIVQIQKNKKWKKCKKRWEKLQIFTSFIAKIKNFPIVLIQNPWKEARRVLINDSDMSTGNFDLKQSSKHVKSSFLPDSHAMAHADQEYWSHSSFH